MYLYVSVWNWKLKWKDNTVYKSIKNVTYILKINLKKKKEKMYTENYNIDERN